MTESRAEPRRWPEEHPELLPLLPLVLSVWMDGVLSADELDALERHVADQRWLTDDATEALAPWLDAVNPPTPSDVQHLGRRIREAGVDDPAATASMSDLGLALWRAAGAPSCCWDDDDAVEGLRELETSLGVLGAEAARRMTGTAVPATPAPPSTAPRGLDPGLAVGFLEAHHADLRQRVRALLARPELALEPGLPLDTYRERVLDAVRFLADEGLGRLGYPGEFGGADDPAAAVAAFETLAFGDLSIVVKFGVQFGLFGGSVLHLGTRAHHERYLADIGSLRLPGCYAMTETGHGSNVRDLETTATYDADSDDLVVHSPGEGAGKDYIGNAARHGRLATVFARLIVAGQDHGVHAVMVPLRDDAGTTLPGIRIEDRGLKLGLNGVDNGRIWFDEVRVPRANLLDRFATIDQDGVYRSPIPSSGRRFFTMLRTLVAGRVSVAAAALSATKVGLTIAVRYADERRQFGPKGGEERPILDYPLVQRSLAPALATTFGIHFATRALQRSYADPAGADEAELEVRAAGLKAYASDHCVRALQACREACGGLGYMADMRFAALKADTDVFTTFEGANGVLYQLVSKGLLSRYRDQMGDLDPWRALQYLGERAETTLTELNPVATRRTDRNHLHDPAFHAAAMRYREDRLLRSAAQRMRARLRDGMDSFLAVSEVQDHLVTLARAHVERVVHDHLREAVVDAPSPGLSEALHSLAALFALSRVEADRGWFLEAGYLEAGKSRAIRAEVGRLCAEVRGVARALVDAFGVPEAVLPDQVSTPHGVP